MTEMCINNAAANSKAQTTTIGLTIAMRVRTIKRFEDAFPLFYGYSLATIYNLHTQVFSCLHVNNLHIRLKFDNIFRIVSHIFHEIEKGPLQLYMVCIHQW